MTDGEFIVLALRLPKRELAARLVILRQSARKVPIARRPDNGPPFSICIGCESVDGDACKPGCWVSFLEAALHTAEGT